MHADPRQRLQAMDEEAELGLDPPPPLLLRRRLGRKDVDLEKVRVLREKLDRLKERRPHRTGGGGDAAALTGVLGGPPGAPGAAPPDGAAPPGGPLSPWPLAADEGAAAAANAAGAGDARPPAAAAVGDDATGRVALSNTALTMPLPREISSFMTLRVDWDTLWVVFIDG